MPPKAKRPGAVTTAAVLLFVYAGLCMPCGCWGVAVSVHPGFGHGPPPLPGLKEELFTVHGLYLLVGGVMVWAGAGVLRLMPAARWTAYWATAGHVSTKEGLKNPRGKVTQIGDHLDFVQKQGEDGDFDH